MLRRRRVGNSCGGRVAWVGGIVCRILVKEEFNRRYCSIS
jgi:hypothetical protein